MELRIPVSGTSIVPEVAGYFSNTDNALLISYARQAPSKFFNRWQPEVAQAITL